MKERPILFSAPMVRAILKGRKTQTRRIIKPQPSNIFLPCIGDYNRTMTDRRTGEQFPSEKTFFGASDENECYPFPFGVIGERLWVKETFATQSDGTTAYRAEGPKGSPYPCLIDDPICPGDEDCRCKWHPSIFMPRKLSRILLEITEVRVERLQSITEADAKAEGIESWMETHCAPSNPLGLTLVEFFGLLWNSIHGAEGWHSNPWVWVITFKRIG